MKSAREICDLVSAFEKIPDAVQAMWDGDHVGWMLRIEVVWKLGRECRSNCVATLRDSGDDLRLFNGHVPPWPESEIAKEAGRLIESELRIPFYFPSPNEPEDDCPDWIDRHLGKKCRSCDKLLLQERSLPWCGSCYQCHLKACPESSVNKPEAPANGERSAWRRGLLYLRRLGSLLRH